MQDTQTQLDAYDGNFELDFERPLLALERTRTGSEQDIGGEWTPANVLEQGLGDIPLVMLRR